MASGKHDPEASRSADPDRLDAIRRELAALARELGSVLPPPDRADTALESLAGGLLWQRSTVAEHLGADFVDPASNVLLFLYARGPGAAPTSGACCDAARVPRTTGLRWIAVLESRGLVRSLVDPNDKRKTTISLSDTGRETMRRCLTAIADAPVDGVLRA